MKATQLLENQHREIEQLFEQLDSAEEGDRKIVREALAQSLVAHTMVEKEMFYPLVRTRLGESIELPLEEHNLVDIALSMLLATPVDDPRFTARAQVLKKLFDRHVNETEIRFIDATEEVLDEEQQSKLGERMEARFDAAREDYAKLLETALEESMPPSMRKAPQKKPARAAAGRARPSAKRAAPQKRTAAATKRGAAPKRKAPAAKTTKRAAPQKRTTATQKRGSTTQKRGTSGVRKATQKRSAAR